MRFAISLAFNVAGGEVIFLFAPRFVPPTFSGTFLIIWKMGGWQKWIDLIMVSGDERCDDDKGKDQTHIHFEVATGLRSGYNHLFQSIYIKVTMNQFEHIFLLEH